MNFEKITEFVRQLLMVFIIIYLTRKLFALEDRIIYLEKKYISDDEEIEEEYSTENFFEKIMGNNLNNPVTLQIPTCENPLLCSRRKVAEVPVVIKTIQQTSKPAVISEHSNQYSINEEPVVTKKPVNEQVEEPVIEQVLNEQSVNKQLVNEQVVNEQSVNKRLVNEQVERIEITPTKFTLKELQDLAISKNIDLKTGGRNKTRKQLLEEINF